jgi:broad-specificity NMP kinase
MTGRLKLIEQQLIGIDSAAFQNLCDIYLALREQEFASFNRTGSQFGKQKTVKGTPDTFFRLKDGSLRYVEFTTKEEGLVAKIKEDIDKCLDPSKTGVPVNEVNKIIICFNSRLTVADETEITKYAAAKNIQIELIGLDWIALEIYLKYLILAKDILGIPLDTGQLLPLESFIQEYNNKAGKLSTPLDNEFLHRKSELTDIESNFNNNNILIISGFPGVGKTKIALEYLSKFLLANSSYEAFAVSKKDMDISEDLRIHLQQDKNYVLLVDDANRQLVNFKQILGVFKESRKGDIKLIITVRDYALNDVINECSEYDPHKIVINKFTDEEIVQLISSDSFEIRNTKYQRRIVELADGNARLAVMAARLAKLQQEFFLLGDVSDLYDSYFQTFIKDFDIFGNKPLIKTLGLISFFFTLDRSNKELIQNILTDFELDYHAFNEAIDELQKREFVEVQYNHVRVSEQVMATYFFYKVFIKDEILSFKTLLNNYYFSWKKRFSDTIIPSNNSFGYENVFKKINTILDDFLNSVYGDEEKVLDFFSLFWFYKREETLNYFHLSTKKLPQPENPIYSTKLETTGFTWHKDKTLDYLGKLFTHKTESFIPALELSFEYCRKKPEFFPELIKLIRDTLLFDEVDERSGFSRQVELFQILITKFKEKQQLYIEAFFELSVTFLSHHFQIHKGGRNHSITFYYYPIPNNDVIKEFRKDIWLTLFENYDLHPIQVLSIIKYFKPGYQEPIKEILELDLSLLLPFIESKLDSDNFENIYFVHDFVNWLDRLNLTDKNYQKLKEKYYSKEFEYFRKLDWDRVRGKRDYDFDKYEDFQKLKEEDLRGSFIFKEENEFAELHKAISNTLSIEGNNGWSIYQSLDIIVEENFNKNDTLGFNLLQSILKNYPRGMNPLYKPLTSIVHKSEEWVLKLWNIINEWSNENKIYWQLAFFDCLPKEFANEFYKDVLLKTYSSFEKNIGYLRFESVEKYLPIDKDIIHKTLRIIVDKIENNKLSIALSYHFFENYSKFINEDFELLSKAYIQQEKISSHFDLERKGLKTLLEIKQDFLYEYLTQFYTDTDWLNRNNHNHLPFVWDLDNHEAIIEKAADLIIEHNPYFGIGDYSLNILFSHLTEAQQTKAKAFSYVYFQIQHRLQENEYRF